MHILQRKSLVTIDVLYFIPRTTILNEFLWQLDDQVPDLPRVHKFLCYWREHIEAVISSVEVAYADEHGMRHVSADFKL